MLAKHSVLVKKLCVPSIPQIGICHNALVNVTDFQRTKILIIGVTCPGFVVALQTFGGNRTDSQTATSPPPPAQTIEPSLTPPSAETVKDYIRTKILNMITITHFPDANAAGRQNT